MILNLPFGEYKTDNYGFPLWEFESGLCPTPLNTISNLPLLTKEKKINRANEGNPVYLITRSTKTRTEDDDNLNDSGDMAILFATLDYGEARRFLENEQKLNKAYMYYGEHEPFFLVEKEEENSNNRISIRNTISICSINTDEEFKNGLILSSFDLYTFWS